MPCSVLPLEANPGMHATDDHLNPDCLQECSAQAVSMILWAVAKRGMAASMQPPVLYTLLDASAQRLLTLLPPASPQVRCEAEQRHCVHPSRCSTGGQPQACSCLLMQALHASAASAH